MTDHQGLLAEYVRTGSEDAFRELVSRYLDLVYSTALRLVEGDAHRAQDVAQTVFVDLARMARTLAPEVMLGGWLHRHTCFVAAHTLRGERRRQIRERQAVEMNALQNDPGPDYTRVAPVLDEAINELQEAETNPRARIPEFALLSEQDWLNAARMLGKRTQFDAATDLRVAMAELRQSAQNKFATEAQYALTRYAKDHEDRFPTDLAQLKPYLSVDDAILDRYTIEPARPYIKSPGQDWDLTQKSLMDEEYDHFIAIGTKGYGYDPSEFEKTEKLPPEVQALKRVLDPVLKEFTTANHGQEPTGPAQLAPYLKTDEQRTALQRVPALRQTPAGTNNP